ncbi:MAG: polysaccharide deacetylase family protein [Acidimicrobiales bacterium]
MQRRQFLALAGLTVGAGSALRPFVVDVSGGEEIAAPRNGVQRIIWSVATSEPRVALTFDDGPDPRLTPQILDILARYETRATFMAMGYNAQQYPELVAAVADAGHEIGHHSWRHLNLATASVEDTRLEIEMGARVTEEAAGRPVRLFRPPKGRLSEAALRLVAHLGHDLVMWSVSRGALDVRSPDLIADHVVGRVDRGDIIDLHDGIGRGTFDRRGVLAPVLLRRRREEIGALPRILEELATRGFQLATVSELLAASPVDRR